jgi:phosphatidylserine/phosphatidylglycerophosphate/cardiolipin synthase-like enzyme
MRLKQWSFSIILFLFSLGFLYYSKNLFPPQAPREATAIALPQAPTQKDQVVLLANKDYYPVLKEYFHNAQKSIHGTIFLFKTASFRDNEPADLMRELIAARKRNVNVDLVIELSSETKEYSEANRRAAETLAKAGCTIRQDLDSITTHSKVFVVDGRYCFVGSHNFTHAAMAMNEELSLFVDSPELATQIEKYIEQIPLQGKL